MEHIQPHALLAHPLFRDVFADEAAFDTEAARGGYSVVRFAPGESISHDAGRWMAFVLRGRAKVYSTDATRQVLLRSVSSGDLIGVAQMFAGSSPPMSRIMAEREIVLLMLEESAVRRLFDASPQFRDNCLAFLADRVAFLNRKIATVTAGSAERRLALTLDGMAGEQDEFTLNTSLQTLADALDISRASLYRALEALEQDGFLIRSGKRMRLHNRADMLARYH